MRRHLKRSLVTFIAVLFLLLGLVGLVLPILQGVLFIAIGLLLLSLVSERVRTFLDKHTVRFPVLHRAIRIVEDYVTRVVGKI